MTGKGKRLAAALAVAVLAAVLAAPAHPARAQTPSGGDRAVTDAAGRQVRLPRHIARVFAAGLPAAVALYAVAPEKLVGWPRALSDEEKRLLPGRYAGLPVTGRLTGRNGEGALDAVKAQHPDLILDIGTVNGRYAALADRVQERTGVPYLLLDGSLAGSGALYRRLGDVLGVPEQAAALARDADATLAEAARRLAAVPPERRPRIYYGRGADGLETAPQGSIVAEILEAVGAVNVAGNVAGAGKGTFVKVTADQLRGWDPDAILTSDAAFGRALGSDPQWQTLRAVRGKRIYVAPRFPFAWIDEPPGVNRLVGVKWLLALLYPDPALDDVKEAAADFYERVYHRRPSVEELAGLLAPSP